PSTSISPATGPNPSSTASWAARSKAMRAACRPPAISATTPRWPRRPISARSASFPIPTAPCATCP
ncbi:hypothetical protein LTR94_038432, partial [Friedmanniomyces endolithicus]